MTPEELAALHPKLYHVTETGAWASIQKIGLLSTSHLLDLFEINSTQREVIESNRRAKPIEISHRFYGNIMINDQFPLQENALSKCLDDNLYPKDWLKLLNSRVFFWPSE
ncbi:MAG: hypothetical protein Q8K60_05950 [Parachlamydiaceae bacterium]|nr:hypothetical protein [Parachlamydiaceae bacterium]